MQAIQYFQKFSNQAPEVCVHHKPIQPQSYFARVCTEPYGQFSTIRNTAAMKWKRSRVHPPSPPTNDKLLNQMLTPLVLRRSYIPARGTTVLISTWRVFAMFSISSETNKEREATPSITKDLCKYKQNRMHQQTEIEIALQNVWPDM